MSAPITQSAECVLHTAIWQTRHTCQYGVGGDKFRNISNEHRYVHGGARKHTHTPHLCVINYKPSRQRQIWPEKSFPSRRCQLDKGRKRGEKQETQRKNVGEQSAAHGLLLLAVYLTDYLFCSFEPLLYLSVAAIGWPTVTCKNSTCILQCNMKPQFKTELILMPFFMTKREN